MRGGAHWPCSSLQGDNLSTRHRVFQLLLAATLEVSQVILSGFPARFTACAIGALLCTSMGLAALNDEEAALDMSATLKHRLSSDQIIDRLQCTDNAEEARTLTAELLWRIRKQS